MTRYSIGKSKRDTQYFVFMSINNHQSLHCDNLVKTWDTLRKFSIRRMGVKPAEIIKPNTIKTSQKADWT